MISIVTGGAGFIGSELVKQLLDDPITNVVVFDCLNYAARPFATWQHITVGDPAFYPIFFKGIAHQIGGNFIHVGITNKNIRRHTGFPY